MYSNIYSVLITATLLASATAPAIAMEFKYVSTGGNVVGSEWISAEGEITNSTADEFETFLNTEGLKKYRFTVVLNSDGGSLYGGLELGKKIRENKLPTSIGRSIVDGNLGSGHTYTTTPGKCLSACAFAFLGGVTRSAKSGELGIHQFYRDYAISNPNSKIFDARDLQSQQAITGQLVAYTSFMGIDPSFIAKSSSTPPTSMYFLTNNDLVDMKITIDEDQFGPWVIKANSSRIYLESKTNNNKEAYIFCGNDGRVKLSVFNPDLRQQNYSFENYKSDVSILNGVYLFQMALPKSFIKPLISNGIPGLEVLLPTNFSQMTKPNSNWGGLGPGELTPYSLVWMFSYNLSYENFQNGVAAIFRSCKN
jgi:hypothetical protein